MNGRFVERQQERSQRHVRAVAGPIDQIERGFLRDDPRFVRRMYRLERAGVLTAITVVTLLVASAALLTVGLASRSEAAWGAGALSFIGAFAIDGWYRRWLRS